MLYFSKRFKNNLTFQNLPFCDISTNENGETKTKISLEIEILHSFERRFNFTSSLVNANQDWGILVNNSWTGVIGHILNGVNGIFYSFKTNFFINCFFSNRLPVLAFVLFPKQKRARNMLTLPGTSILILSLL